MPICMVHTCVVCMCVACVWVCAGVSVCGVHVCAQVCMVCVHDMHVCVRVVHVCARVCVVCMCVVCMWVCAWRECVWRARVCTGVYGVCMCVGMGGCAWCMCVHAHMDLRLLDSTGEIDGLFPRSGHHRQQAWVGTGSMAPELHNVLLWPWILSVGAPCGGGWGFPQSPDTASTARARHSSSPCRQVPRLGRNVQAEL